jgi:aminoglycoside phosphotransferase (APT) family kinase protein
VRAGFARNILQTELSSLGEHVNLQCLSHWMDREGLGKGPIVEPELLSGGTQNILLRFVRDNRSYVLRRPPLNPYLDGSETMRREARVLRAIASSAVPHARLIAACGDEKVLGAAFYLMESVDGFTAVRGLPKLHAASPEIRHQMGLSLTESLAALHMVDYAQVGLGDFGRPDGYLARQVPRLLAQLERYEAYKGWSGRVELGDLEGTADWLISNMPRDAGPSITHGDFHMGNAMFSQTGPDVRAIVDWELSTIGDALCDLGCLLATWADPDGSHPGCISITPWSGFPSEPELVRHYGQVSGRDVTAIDWYVVFGCFRLAVLLEGTHARAVAGKADPSTGNWLHQTAINLLKRAESRI